MKAQAWVLSLGLLVFGAPASADEPAPEHPGAVPAFVEACLTGGLTFAAREQALTASGWTDEPVTVDVEAFGASPAIEKNFDFTNPKSVKQWSRTVDGVTLRGVLASFPARRRYPMLCAVVVPEVRYGWPYEDAFEPAIKGIGLKGKSTDLPHYYEYSGKIDGDHPVRAELFGRTRAVPERNSMHLYVAF